MKLQALLCLVLAAVLPLSAPRTAHAAADVSFDYFYDALLPYGEWIEVTGYGLCWRPTEVDPDWAPYSDGYWAFTDAGWTWVGYEEFAGIVYHYGRWMNVEDTGWCWVPDYEWGPGWVSWRSSDDYVGWAPLPPRAYWQPEIGISTWVDTAYDIGPGSYSFCRVRDFGAPVLRPLIFSRSRNVTIIRNTVNITNITYNSYGDVPVIYNGGPSFAFISNRCERPIPTLKLVRNTRFDRADFRGGPGRFSPNARAVGNQLIVNAPIVAPPDRPAFLKDKVKRVVKGDKVATGWAGVKDGKVRDDLRQRFQRETKGLTPYTAPAKPVAVADLKVVPVQADPNAVSPVFTGRGPRGKGDRQPPATVPNPVADTAQPADPGAVTGGPLKPFKDGADGRPSRKDQAVTGNPVVTPPVPDAVTDPRAAEKAARENQRPKMDQDKSQNPVVVVPPNLDKTTTPEAPPTTGPVTAEPREGRGPRPMKDAPAGGFRPPSGGQQAVTGEDKPGNPGVNPAQAQAAAEAARAAREQAAIQQQKMDAEKLRAAQAEADKSRSDQERMARQREAEAGAAAIREKQATAREQANTQQQKMEADKLRAAQAEAEKARTEQERIARQREADANAAAMRQKNAADASTAAAEKEKMQAQQQQRAAQAEREKLQADQERMSRQRDAESAAAAQQKQQAEAAKQSEAKRQQMEAQAGERQRQQQEQIAEQRRQQQMEQQRAAQESAKQQAAERARDQQMEQQRATQETAKQQAAEQRRQQQMEQQRAAQEAAKQQAAERARDQQMQQQRAAQEAAKQQAAEQRRAQQMEAQRAAQEAARQQAAERAREQQMEQQRAAQEAAKQQAAEQRRQQQMEQQRAAQESARQQAAEQQRRAMDAQREQAARQQAEAQRAAQQQAAQAAQAAQQQAAQEARRAEKEKDKDKGR